MALPPISIGQDQAGAGTGAGYTGMVDMQGMQIPVLDGVAHFKGKNFQVGTTGAVMDEKGAVQGFVEDGVVNPPDPAKVRNFMNGMPTTPAANPITDTLSSLVAQKNTLRNDALGSVLGGDTLKGVLDSLGVAESLGAAKGKAKADLLSSVGLADLAGKVGGLKQAKNDLKSGMLQKMVGMLKKAL